MRDQWTSCRKGRLLYLPKEFMDLEPYESKINAGLWSYTGNWYKPQIAIFLNFECDGYSKSGKIQYSVYRAYLIEDCKEVVIERKCWKYAEKSPFRFKRKKRKIKSK